MSASFPFPHLEKKEQFLYTFLNEVALKILLPQSIETLSLGNIQRFFHQLFKLEVNESHKIEMVKKRVKVGNEDSGVTFEFDKDSIQISISQNHYSDFKSSMLPLLEKLVEAYAMWFDSVRELQLKFIDVWPLASVTEVGEGLLKDLKEAVFSPSLRTSAYELDENFRGLSVKDSDVEVYVKYGSYIPSDKNQNAGMALESRAVLNAHPIPVSEVCDCALHINDILYDVFMWAVTPEIVAAMRNPQMQ